MKYILIAIITLNMVVSFVPITFAQHSQHRLANQSVKESVVKVDDSIEIDEEKIRKGLIVTLAVNSITVFHCPNRPKQVLFGKGSEIGITLAAPVSERPEVYIRPITAN